MRIEMFQNPVFKIVISALAVCNIVGVFCFYILSARLNVTGSEITMEEAASFVSTSYNTLQEETVEEEAETGTTTQDSEIGEIAAEGVTNDPSEYPTLELTDRVVTLNLGERFNYLNYLKTYRDVDGGDLSRVIRLYGDVNVYQAGTYVVTYSVTSKVTGKTTDVSLTVQVR